MPQIKDTKQYLVYAEDDDALKRRMNVRDHHLVGAKQLKENGNFIMGGAMLNEKQEMIGSIMILQFNTET